MLTNFQVGDRNKFAEYGPRANNQFISDSWEPAGYNPLNRCPFGSLLRWKNQTDMIGFLRINRNFFVGGGFTEDVMPRAEGAGCRGILTMGLQQNLVWYYRPG